MHSLADLDPSFYFWSSRTRYGFYAASCCWTGQNTLPFLIKCLVDSIFLRFAAAFVGLLWTFGGSVQRVVDMY
jgi:hypothetical protein